MWRNPITNRFEAGDPPTVGQDGVGVPSIPGQGSLAPVVPPRGGDIHRAWTDFVPTPENGLQSGGNPVRSVADVLSGGQSHKDEGIGGKDYGPAKSDHDDVVEG